MPPKKAKRLFQTVPIKKKKTKIDAANARELNSRPRGYADPSDINLIENDTNSINNGIIVID